MWQSQVEIEHYFIAYFNFIIVFKALYHRTFVKSGAHTLHGTVRYSCIYVACMRFNLDSISALQHF